MTRLMLCFALGIQLLFLATHLQAHDHVHTEVVVEGGNHWHGGYDTVHVDHPWYHHDHVYIYNGNAYPYYYGGYPYYYYDPRFYYGPPAPVAGVNVNIHVP